MVSRDYIIEKLKSLPEESLEEIADFIEFVGTKKRRKPETISESMRVFKNVVRGFSLVHDPKGSHYENLRGEAC